MSGHSLYRNLLIAFTSFIVLPVAAFAQQAVVHASIDSSQILIGEQFHLQVEAKINPAENKITWASVPDTFNNVQVVSRDKIDTVSASDLITYHQRITLTSFDSGQWKIPSFAFKIIPVNNNAEPTFAYTDSLLINVSTVAVDTTKPFKPIKTIRAVPFNWRDYIWYFVIGIIILIGIAAIIFYIRESRKKPAAPLPPKPKEPPYETAMKALQKMEKEKAWQREEIKNYYTQLTDILRLYIERQFGIPALEQTTDELLENIKPVTVLSQQKNNLKEILTTADLVKFAKMKPLDEEHYHCLRSAIEIVEWTKPKPKVEEKK